MAILRTIECDVCKNTEAEPAPNAGFVGWGGLQGISLNGIANPTLCPRCLTTVAKFVDNLGG